MKRRSAMLIHKRQERRWWATVEKRFRSSRPPWPLIRLAFPWSPPVNGSIRAAWKQLWKLRLTGQMPEISVGFHHRDTEGTEK